MRSGLLSISVAPFFTIALSACVFDLMEDSDILDADAVGEDQLEVVSANGMSLNGMSLNGMSLNGMSLNGMSLNGMSLNGMSLNGMSLNGSELTGVRSSGQRVSGNGLVGARLSGILASGKALPMRIDSAARLATPNDDVWAYGVSYQADDSSWHPMCGTADGAPILSIPLQGTWNYGSDVPGGGSWTASTTAFTFGCRGTALAKCVELGYKPWKTVDGALLRDHHQACTRAIRADYCGNGRSYTANGTLINIYDNRGIQRDAAYWLVDAEWTPNGARCIASTRTWHAGMGLAPSCWYQKLGLCGYFASGTLLIDEYDTTRDVTGAISAILNQR